MSDIIPIWRIKRLETTTSTNDDAKHGASSHEPEGLVIWARQQTAARGRHGRSWESPEGNLYISILLRPGCDIGHAPRYGFVAALAMHDTVRSFLPKADVTLKWPNDVLVHGKKIGGILLEASSAEDKKIDWLVVGIGINVACHPNDVLYPATSLQTAGAGALDLENVLEMLLGRFHDWKVLVESDGFAPLRKAWLAAAQKGQLRVRMPDQITEGTFSTIDETGNLVLCLADGSKKTIAAGDVLAH